MAAITESISNFYNFTIEARDPRVVGWFSTHPVTLLAIETFYILSCLYIGPWLMKNRPPYNIQHVIRAHNVLQILLNLFLFHEGFFALFLNEFNFRCQEVDSSYNEMPVRLLLGAWWFFVSRVLDVLDTAFFLLRKKNNHVTFLHVYHHSLMIFGAWLGLTYVPGGNGIVAAALNSFVHCFMYTYYFITALGPEYKRYLWWKKYLTQMQIFQFVIIGLHAFQALFRDCPFPKPMTMIIFVNSLVFIYLFSQFYIKMYLRPKSNNKKD